MNRKKLRGEYNKRNYLNYHNQRKYYPHKTNFYGQKYTANYEDQNKYPDEINVINAHSKNNTEVENRSYEYDENKINEERQNQKLSEFNKIVGNTLIKFYEDDYSKIMNKMKTKMKVNEKEITIQDIKKECIKKNYIISESDQKILQEMINSKNTEQAEYYNRLMFYEKNKKSIYVPHILKNQNNILSIFIENKNLLSTDFQIRSDTNYLFTKILEDRLISINNNEPMKDAYGLTTNDDGSIGILYTTVDEEYIRKLLLCEEINNVKLGSITYLTNPTDFNIQDINNNYIRGLSTEALILLNIYNKLGQENIRKLPRLLLYEANCFIDGEPVIKFIQPGYKEVDFVFQSMINCNFSEENNPLFIQKEYNIGYEGIEELITKSPMLKINKGTIYFVEIKNSYPNNISEIIKKMILNVSTFRNIFIKEKIIDEHTQIEILIIYDFKKSEICSGIAKAININNLYEDLKGLKIKIIYCKPTYILYSLDNLMNEVEKLKNEQKFQKEQMEKQMQFQKEQMEKQMQSQKEQMEKQMEKQQKLIETLQKEMSELKKSNDINSNISNDRMMDGNNS